MRGMHRRFNLKIVVDFNAMQVSTGMIGGYIKRLYEREGFKNIGYSISGNRVYLYTYSYNLTVIKYFEDRCPGMIEEACMNCSAIAHDFENMFSDEEDPKHVYKFVKSDSEYRDITNDL